MNFIAARRYLRLVPFDIRALLRAGARILAHDPVAEDEALRNWIRTYLGAFRCWKFEMELS